VTFWIGGGGRKGEREVGREGWHPYLNEDEGDISLGAELDEVGGLEGGLGEKDAVVGHDA